MGVNPNDAPSSNPAVPERKTLLQIRKNLNICLEKWLISMTKPADRAALKQKISQLGIEKFGSLYEAVSDLYCGKYKLNPTNRIIQGFKKITLEGLIKKINKKLIGIASTEVKDRSQLMEVIKYLKTAKLKDLGKLSKLL